MVSLVRQMADKWKPCDLCKECGGGCICEHGNATDARIVLCGSSFCVSF